MKQTKSHVFLVRLCACAMMAAIVFVGNYLRIKFPVPLGGVSAITLANILCALSGILLGPWWGFLSAGMGSAIYDLMDPSYVAEAPITFCTKGMYGLVAGLVLYYVFKSAKEKYGAQAAATGCAALTYLVAYSVKNFFYNGTLNNLSTAALRWALVVSKLPATLVNGVLATIFAPILGVALMKALKSAHLGDLLRQ